MTMSLSPDAVADIRKLVDHACTKERAYLPCTTVIEAHRTLGTNGNSVSPPASQAGPGCDDLQWLASCTKLVPAIACMQLVEQGKLGLDDNEIVEKLCPELADVKVLQNGGSLVDKNRPITLRMLLTHTAGFGYSFLEPKLQDYARQNHLGQTEYDEFCGMITDFQQPLVNQPGDRFEYSISVDWAGILIERVTGLKLNDYMQQHIFTPLNVKNVSMFPSSDMKEQLIGIWQRGKDGRLAAREYPVQRYLDDECTADIFHSGGAGLFGSIREFKILSVLLNDGTSSVTGKVILSPGTVREMLTNQIPLQPDFGRRYLPAVNPDLVQPTADLYPLCPRDTPQGWGLSFMITPGLTRRSETTAQWSGLSNIFWWCDRETGVAGIVASQVLPFVDPQVAKLWVEVEMKVYEGLC
ncbi:beta-lactamase/transpeptidase-like protein [Aspergillus insuetus]